MHIMVVYQAAQDATDEISAVHEKIQAAGLNPTPVQDSGEHRSFMVFSKEEPSKELMRWMMDYALTDWVLLKNDEVDGPKVLDDFGALARSI